MTAALVLKSLPTPALNGSYFKSATEYYTIRNAMHFPKVLNSMEKGWYKRHRKSMFRHTKFENQGNRCNYFNRFMQHYVNRMNDDLSYELKSSFGLYLPDSHLPTYICISEKITGLINGTCLSPIRHKAKNLFLTGLTKNRLNRLIHICI